jgi:BA14K-like protein
LCCVADVPYAFEHDLRPFFAHRSGPHEARHRNGLREGGQPVSRFGIMRCLLDAFSSREPVSTSLENAMAFGVRDMKTKLALIAAVAGSLALPVVTSAPADARTVILRPSGPVAGAGWHGGGGWRGGGWNRGYYRGHRGYGWGPALGGFAAGAIIGGALAAQPPAYYGAPVYAAPPAGDDVAYCMQRFKSYDPASGTYLGYDGLRHPCP